MKQYILTAVTLLAIAIGGVGCDLVTKPSTAPGNTTARDLVINEVFTISPDKYYSYSWIELANKSTRSLPMLQSVRPITGYLYGEGGTVRKTSDDGRSWFNLPTGTSETINSLSIIVPDTGFAVGNNGLLLRGATPLGDSTIRWTQDNTLGTTLNLNTLLMPSVYDLAGSRTGWIGADSGAIWRTTDRGHSWVRSNAPSKKRIRSMALPFAGVNTQVISVWGCGDSGTVFRTGNAGSTWNSVASSWNQVQLNGIAVIKGSGGPTTDTAFVVGSTGQVFRVFGSAGALVLDSMLTVGASMNGVSSRDGRVWAVGDSGYIFYKPSVGSEWKQLAAGFTTANLRYVFFADTNRGFIFGDGGTALTTSDGGIYWNLISSGTTQNLKGGMILPIIRTLQSFYVLTGTAKIKHFYSDPFGVTNFDFITGTDTGTIILNLAPRVATTRVSPGGFVVVYNDSGKFGDHTKLGPADGVIFNALVGGYRDTSVVGGGSARWDLLSSGELRLFKYDIELRDSTINLPGGGVFRFSYPVSSDSTIIDVVRYGNFLPTGIDPFPNNRPVGFMPEWSSISRYQDDPGEFDPTKMNTASEFYICDTPIPMWGSQLRKNK